MSVGDISLDEGWERIVKSDEEPLLCGGVVGGGCVSPLVEPLSSSLFMVSISLQNKNAINKWFFDSILKYQH